MISQQEKVNKWNYLNVGPSKNTDRYESSYLHTVVPSTSMVVHIMIKHVE